LPLLALPLMKIQLLPDFVIGLMIAASVPCTMAAASVWTRKAGGNDAAALRVTLLTNGLGVIVTPLWLNVASSSHVAFGLVDMMQRLLVSALLPATIGQLARLSPSLRTFASRHKSGIGVLAQAFILVIVFTA